MANTINISTDLCLKIFFSLFALILFKSISFFLIFMSILGSPAFLNLYHQNFEALIFLSSEYTARFTI